MTRRIMSVIKFLFLCFIVSLQFVLAIEEDCSRLLSRNQQNSSFSEVFARKSLDYNGFENFMKSRGSVPSTYQSALKKAWDFLEASNLPSGAPQNSFTILTLEGQIRSGKTHLLRELQSYLGIDWNPDFFQNQERFRSFFHKGEIDALYLEETNHSPQYINMALLKMTLKNHDGSHPLLLIFDTLQYATVHYQFEVMEMLQEHIENLAEKRDSLKVIFVMDSNQIRRENVYSQPMLLAQLLQIWSTYHHQSGEALRFRYSPNRQLLPDIKFIQIPIQL